jgi:outer membrane protein assembly factor BamB
VFAATWGQITCHSIRNLSLLWKNDLKGMSYDYCQSMEVEDDRVFVGQTGRLCAIDAKSGATLWMSEKMGLIGAATTLAHWNNGLVVASAGKIQCLSVSTGDVLWEDSLPGLGHAPLVLATHCDYTNYNSSTLLQAVEEQRDNNRRRNN